MPADHHLYTRVKRKLHSVYRNFRCMPLNSVPSWKRVNDRFEMKLSSQDWMDRAFFLGDYDDALLCAIDTFVSRGDQCIDIGAHKGYVSLSLASTVGPEGKIFAFEPDAGVRSQLIENVEHNQCSNIQIFSYALGEEEGEATFFVSQQPGWSSRFPNKMAQTKINSTVTVPVKVLDELVTAKEMEVDPTRLSFVKIDCEGSEPGVLSGMKDLLAKANPVLWIEVNRDSLRVAQSSIEALQDIILHLGLRLYTFEFDKPVWGPPRIQFRAIQKLAMDQDIPYDIVATKRALV